MSVDFVFFPTEVVPSIRAISRARNVKKILDVSLDDISESNY